MRLLRTTTLVMLASACVFPLSAKPKLKAELKDISVLFGPGIVKQEGEGYAPPNFQPSLTGTLLLEGPWKIEQLKLRAHRVKGKERLPLEIQAQPQGPNLMIRADWPKATGHEGWYLEIQVLHKGKLLAQTRAAITAHFLPASRPARSLD